MSGLLKDKTAFITGATGFVGGRLSERLVLEQGCHVRALVRSYSRAVRIGRLPVKMVAGDLLARDTIEEALQGCDYVFHCAVGFEGSAEDQRRTNVDGTKYLLDASLKAGVKRFVFVSTTMVYGAHPDGDIDENTSKNPDNDVYSQCKLEAEELVLSYASEGLPTSVVQPDIICGPHALAWTLNPLSQLKNNRVILVNGGDGLCNAVYVDDLIDAMLLTVTKNEAVGEAFLVSAQEPVTWQQFYGEFEKILGYKSTISMTAEEAEAFFTGQRGRKSILKEALAILREEDPVRWRVMDTLEMDTLVKVGKSVIPQKIRSSLARKLKDSNGNMEVEAEDAVDTVKPILALGPASIKFHASKVRVRIDKAKQMLGYKPKFTFESGMQLIEKWAKWSNLL